MKQTRQRRNELLITLPSALWLTVLFLVPAVIVFIITFKPADPYGGIGQGWTASNLRSLMNPAYLDILLRTVWISIAATLICIAGAIPAGYYIARVQKRWRRLLVLLVIVPFWTSFLIRIFAWKILLHPEGYIKQTLTWLCIVRSDTSLLYNQWSVLLVMVYTFLPFAILPIYAAAEKFDFQLLEAARDLGAHQLQSFFKIFLPGISRGLLTATLVVFIPALGSYVVPDLVGGPGAEMIGNKIAQRVFVDRNLPHAGGLSSLLTLLVLIPLVSVLMSQGKKEKAETIIEENA